MQGGLIGSALSDVRSVVFCSITSWVRYAKRFDRFGQYVEDWGAAIRLVVDVIARIASLGSVVGGICCGGLNVALGRWCFSYQGPFDA